MIVSYNQIQALLGQPLGLTPRELGEVLTQYGLEVERYIEPCAFRDHLKIAKTLERTEHGLVALIQDTQERIFLPSDLELDSRYIVDCLSGEWQLATPERLGWSSLKMPLWVPNGLNIDQAWEIDDTYIELSIGPNRGDCLSYVGLCRETSLAIQGHFSSSILRQSFLERYKVTFETEPAEIVLEIDAKLAPTYGVAKIIIPTSLRSPFWLERFLIKHGMTPRFSPVDLAQYLMLLFGQPMHAFDARALQGKIQFGYEHLIDPLSLQLLDGKTVNLEGTVPLMRSARGVCLGLAGIMGSLESATENDSRVLYIESAFFEPTMIRQARSFGIVTDASLRFERGVDREGQKQMLEIFCAMIQSIHPQAQCWAPKMAHEQSWSPPVLQTSFQKVSALAGTSLGTAHFEEYFKRIGALIQDDQISWEIPSWRFDLSIEQNFTSELLRIYGMNKLSRSGSLKAFTPLHTIALHDKPTQAFLSRGLQELVTYSFISQKKAELVSAIENLIRLDHPLNQDLAIMRPSLWPSLLDVLSYNQRRHQNHLGVFEKAPIYHRSYPDFQKIVVSAALPVVKTHKQSWPALSSKAKQQEWSYYDIKGLVASLGLRGTIFWVPCQSEEPLLHPDLSAHLLNEQGRIVGRVGLLHPHIQSMYDWPASYLIEIEADCWNQKNKPVFQKMSRYPVIYRDLALELPPGTVAHKILQLVREVCPYYKDVKIFDYYQPEQGPANLGIRIALQSFDQTLEDYQIVESVDKILSHLAEKYQVFLKKQSKE